MLLRLINKNPNLTLLQSAKITFVHISETVMAVVALDGHKIFSCDRLIKSYNLLCHEKQSASSAKFIFILPCIYEI